MASPKLYITYSIAFLVVAGLVTVGYVWWVTRIERFPGLNECVNSYYKYEQNKEWSKAHSMRVPTYQQSVPLGSYISSMESDSKGWELLSYKVVAAVPDQNRVKLHMKFTELAPASHLPKEILEALKSNASQITVESEDSSVWENINGKWFAWETGARSHLTLNHGLVAPNKSLKNGTREELRAP